jgi:hypothetical protein
MMSDERDELADIIAAHNNTSGLGGVARRLPDGSPVYEGEQLLAALILAAGYRKPRQVTTAAELDVLAYGNVIRDDYGIVYAKPYNKDNFWLMVGDHERHPSAHILLPATLIREEAPDA